MLEPGKLSERNSIFRYKTINHLKEKEKPNPKNNKYGKFTTTEVWQVIGGRNKKTYFLQNHDFELFACFL